MEWEPDASAGAWLRERIDDRWRGTMHDIVPRGFAAYARVFHPAMRERPVGREWPPEPADRHRAEWEEFGRSGVEVDTERVSWGEAADAFGTTMHAGAQWHRIVRTEPRFERSGESTDAAGWRYSPPEEGRLDPPLLALLAGVLSAHTSTPDDAYIAVWEGWGGLLGFYGETPARAALTFSQDDEPADLRYVSLDDAELLDRHREMLERSIHDRFNNVFRKRTWQPGVLSDEVSRGPRLSLPNRDHVLFRGSIAELADPDWVAGAPWAHEPAASTPSPSWIWPADRAFAVATEIDWDSTIVAGSAELVRAVCTHPGLEALPLREGAALTWDSDDVNR
ncbi:hypothetical protein [Microbacterium sp.]|uniref:hypothetical protein n=1 Tax=Microbacterium sp. TaxID=51671 RepID=UPI002D770463|nr:hypothetical protein [Microbacterium sp.]HET6301465.1 hypothetical protein [Microbacterium sp.]